MNPRVPAKTVPAPEPLWLRAIGAFVAGRSFESDPSPRVQLASDMAAIAGYEAAARLMAQVEKRRMD